MTITGQRIALHVAENEVQFIKLSLIARTKAWNALAQGIKEAGGEVH